MTPNSPDTSAAPGRRTALFAGTFAPFTIGHADIVRRGLCMFDSVIICLGVNAAKAGSEADARERAEAIARLYAAEPRVSVVTWAGLTADAARELGASVLLRGVRSVRDYEYERDMADANRALFGIDTVMIAAAPHLAHVSSSLVRELRAHGRDVSALLPTPSTI